MNLLDRLVAILSITSAPEWPTLDVVQRGLRANRAITEASILIYDATRGTAAQRAEIAQAIRDGYARYIEPLNIPKVGAFVESLIDAQLPLILAAGPDAAAEFLDRVLPRPTETPRDENPIRQHESGANG